MTDDAEPGERAELQQNDLLWILPKQYAMIGSGPDGFAMQIEAFLGPGDPDLRGCRRVWVRGPVVFNARQRGKVVTVLVPHDQPRAALKIGKIRPPQIPASFDLWVSPSPPAPGQRILRMADTVSGPPMTWWERVEQPDRPAR